MVVITVNGANLLVGSVEVKESGVVLNDVLTMPNDRAGRDVWAAYLSGKRLKSLNKLTLAGPQAYSLRELNEAEAEELAIVTATFDKAARTAIPALEVDRFYSLLGCR
jgi:hypothetical protein